MEGLASLGINLPTLVAQIVNFVILFGLLYLVAYKPIMRMIDERSRKVRESMEQTEFIKQRAEQAEEEAAKRIEAASKEGQELVARAARTGEETRRTEIQRERDEAIDELRREFAGLTIMAAEKVIERSLDKEAHRELINGVLKESGGLKKN
jgi:F-type H+-transporting ATPase subunit b